MLLIRRANTKQDYDDYVSSLLDRTFIPRGVDAHIRLLEEEVRRDCKLEGWQSIPIYKQPQFNGVASVRHGDYEFVPGMYTYVYDPITNEITVHLIVEAA